jgi:hypothetical protein
MGEFQRGRQEIEEELSKLEGDEEDVEGTTETTGTTEPTGTTETTTETTTEKSTDTVE